MDGIPQAQQSPGCPSLGAIPARKTPFQDSCCCQGGLQGTPTGVRVKHSYKFTPLEPPRALYCGAGGPEFGSGFGSLGHHAPPAAEGIGSPYDPEARFRSRHEITWTGYQVHLSETCDPDEVHLITNVETTQATVHESRKTEAIHQALAD